VNEGSGLFDRTSGSSVRSLRDCCRALICVSLPTGTAKAALIRGMPVESKHIELGMTTTDELYFLPSVNLATGGCYGAASRIILAEYSQHEILPR